MDLGDTLPFRAGVDNDGVPVNAATAVLTVTLPDGTTSTPAVTNPSTGEYASDYTTTVASPEGRYLGKWLFTFAGGATTSYEESFDVRSSLITVDEALDHLRANGILTSDTDLEKLQWLTYVASDAVELDLKRALVPRNVTKSYNGGTSVILLKPPVLSVTAVVEDGAAVTDYVLDADAGLLYRGYQLIWSPGLQNVTVTYRVGDLNPPAVARKVALNLVQSAWQGSQQAPHPALNEFQEPDVFVAQSQLSEVERRAYEALRFVSVA